MRIAIVPVASSDVLEANRAANAGRGLPRLATVPERDRRSLGVVGGGASAASALGFDGDLMAVNGACAWLCGQGRVPEYGLLVDPQPIVAGMVEGVDESVRWMVADWVDPSVLDALAGRDVTLISLDDDAVPGGPSAMTRAPILALLMGYRDITLFGADCCHVGDASHIYGLHAPGGKAWPDGESIFYRGWRTNLALIAQAQFLAELAPHLPFMKVHGEHLTADLVNEARNAARDDVRPV